MASMTLANLRSLVRTYVQESSATPLSNAIIDDLINEGQDDLAIRTEYKFGRFLLTGGLVTGQDDYSIPPNIFTVWSVSIQDTAPTGNLTSLGRPTTLQRMDVEFSSWRTDTAGTPVRWWVTKDVVWFHPAPSASFNTTPIELFGPMLPPDLSNDTDLPAALPEYFHRTLARYAAWQWLSIDKENPAAMKLAAFFAQHYLDDAARLLKYVNARERMDYEPLRVHTGRPSTASSLLGDTPGEPD